MMRWGEIGFCWKKRRSLGHGKEFLSVFWEKKPVKDLGMRILCGKFLGNEIKGKCDPIRCTLLHK